jgi:hypothetical protein
VGLPFETFMDFVEHRHKHPSNGDLNPLLTERFNPEGITQQQNKQNKQTL